MLRSVAKHRFRLINSTIEYFSSRRIHYTFIAMSGANRTWNPNLTAEQLNILRDKYTERPNTGKYLHNKDTGVYSCANCNTPLYSSGAKFESGCGWPAFYEEISEDALTYHRDVSHGMTRVEICCGKCGGHLGHVFEGEGWKELLNLPSDTRHCVNSGSLTFSKSG